MVIADPESNLQYSDDQLVVVEITQQPSKRNLAQAKVIEVLGDHMAPGMEIQVAISQLRYPAGVAAGSPLSSLRISPPEVSEQAKLDRVDLRDLPLVTIDGEDAKDFDECSVRRAQKVRWLAIVGGDSRCVALR